MKLCVTVEGHTYDVEIGDLNARPVIAVVNGQPFEVWPEQVTRPAVPELQEHEQVLPAARPSTSAPAAAGVNETTTNRSNSLLAPIPGVIISILVKEGDSVTSGQELFILEAMKMKNSIRANRFGRVGAVCVSQGEHVRKDQVLITYAG